MSPFLENIARMPTFYGVTAHKPSLWVCLLLLCCLGARADGDNLLANPGFEALTADQPARWDTYVQPKPGAVARLDDVAHSGDYAVWLHTPTPYAKEPVNNWSQNIIADFGGETLRVAGFIRVVDAKEAALWLQCWRKKPWGVLAAASTSIDMPVYGTADWQEVSMEVEVPEGTDFVTLRCVLLGTGSAWFDDISVSRATKHVSGAIEEKDGVKKDKLKDKMIDPDAEPLSVSDRKQDTLSGDSNEKDAPDVMEKSEAERQEALVMPLVSRLEAEVRRLREANVLLTDTLLQIQEVNEGLAREMASVQEEIRKRKAEEQHAAAPPLGEAPPQVPPLIPLSEALEGAVP